MIVEKWSAEFIDLITSLMQLLSASQIILFLNDKQNFISEASANMIRMFRAKLIVKDNASTALML